MDELFAKTSWLGSLYRLLIDPLKHSSDSKWPVHASAVEIHARWLHHSILWDIQLRRSIRHKFSIYSSALFIIIFILHSNFAACFRESRQQSTTVQMMQMCFRTRNSLTGCTVELQRQYKSGEVRYHVSILYEKPASEHVKRWEEWAEKQAKKKVK